VVDGIYYVHLSRFAISPGVGSQAQKSRAVIEFGAPFIYISNNNAPA
jgi:hypothetical protein